MSNHERMLAESAGVVGCCSPQAREPLSLIASHGGREVCVCELTEVFERTGPTISHHLKVLRAAGLIAGESRGTWVYDRVEPDALRRLSAVLVPDGVPAARV